MCAGEGVGKGLDIKGKSSKSNNPNRGFVPFCQACTGNFDSGKDDLYEEEGEPPIYVVGSEKIEKEGEDQEQIRLRGGLCAIRNSNGGPPGGSKICRATRRPSEEDLQHKVASSLTDGGSSGTPPGVERRVVMMKAHAGTGNQQPLPFIGYRTGKEDMPVVSDYDILSIAECPRRATRRLKGKARYPMYNGDSGFFDTSLFLDLVFASMEKYRLMVNTKKTWPRTKYLKHKKAVAAVMNRLLPEYQGLGLGDTSSMAVLKSLVDHSRDESKSGAIRHGAEAFNYIFPQAFANQKYPRFTSTTGDDELRVNPDEMNSAGVIEHYKELLQRGCCVPMNYLWLLYETEGPEWVKFWRFAMQKVRESAADHAKFDPDTSIIGCPFFDYFTFDFASKIKTHVKSSLSKKKPGKKRRKDWFDDINGDEGSPCLGETPNGDCG